MTFDDKLLELCKKGERAAQEKLFSIYSPNMLGICIRYAKNLHEAEDVMQEGFIKIFTNIDGFRGDGSFEGWMKRIMINTSLNHYYKAKKSNFETSFDGIRESKIVSEDEEIPISRFSQEEMIDAIKLLPHGYKQVFNMYVFDNYKHREIAELLNISVNTSKSQLSKARNFLKNILLKIEKEIKITE